MMLLLACGAGDPEEAPVIVGDSAGIPIVESRAAEWGTSEPWQLSDAPVLELGVLNGAESHQFYDVRDVARLPGGGIAVANGGSGHIRLFDAGGEFLREVGGEGEGPGEFRSIRSIDIQGDTLFAYDSRLRRITAFDLDGELLRSASLDLPETFTTGQLHEPAWLGSGSVVLIGGAEPPSTFGTIERPPVGVLEFSTTGGMLDTLHVVPGPEEASWQIDAERQITTTPPFGRRPVIAASPGTLYIGTQSRHEVSAYDADGVVSRIVRWAGAPLELTEEDRHEWEQRYLERSTQSEATREMVVRMTAAAPLPERRPAYSEIRVGASGHLWTADYSLPIPGVTPTRWTVFDPEGRLLGAVDVPERFRVHEIGEEWVLGVGRDDNDVEYVRMYRLEKAREAH